MVERLRVDVWSDIVCPFCYIGKRRLENAVREAGLEGEVDVVYHAFELDPAGRSSGPLLAHLARKFGGEAQAARMVEHVRAAAATEGLALDFAKAVAAPTFDAHRVALFAQGRGKGAEVMEGLMRAHFTEGENLAERATLVRIAAAAGVDAGEVERLLASQDLVHEVRTDEAAARAYGIGGVPFFIFDGRFAVSGAQPPDVFREALRAAREPEKAE